MRWETNVKNGVTGLEFDRNDIEMNKVRGEATRTQAHTCSELFRNSCQEFEL